MFVANISLTQSLKSICESAERFEEELPEEMEKLLKAANEERKRRETRGKPCIARSEF